MQKWKVWIDKAAFSSGVLKSPELTAALEDIATEKVGMLPPLGYSKKTHTGKYRAYVTIAADTPEAWRDNLKNNSLLKCL